MIEVEIVLFYYDQRPAEKYLNQIAARTQSFAQKLFYTELELADFRTVSLVLLMMNFSWLDWLFPKKRNASETWTPER